MSEPTCTHPNATVAGGWSGRGHKAGPTYICLDCHRILFGQTGQAGPLSDLPSIPMPAGMIKDYDKATEAQP